MANNKNIERELEKGLKEILLNMNEEEFTEYFKQLIEKYYSVLFTFQEDYSKYYEESYKQYNSTIKLAKDLLGFKYNNLDNYENLERLKQAEEIAFNQMNTIYFMEKSYSNLIYYNAVEELNYINRTLASLIELYKANPSEALLDVIKDRFTSTVSIVKQIKKLPVNEGSILDYAEEITFRKEHFKEKEKPSEDVNSVVFTVPIFSLYLKEVLESFEDIVKDLEEILPEEVISSYNYDLDSSEMVQHYYNLKASGVEEEEALELTAYLSYLKKKNNQGFLYEILDSWS